MCSKHNEQIITVRLTESFCMRPTLQGLTWFEYCEISKEVLLRRFIY